MKKRICSLVLAVVMVLSLVPTLAFGAEIVDSGKAGPKATWTLDSEGVLTVSGTESVTEIEGDPDKARVKKIVVESGISKLYSDIFAGYSAVTDVELPDTLTDIATQAFCNCTSLESLKLPNSVKYIDDYAFAGVPLKNVNIPTKLRSVGEYAFRDSSFDTVTIPASLTTIGDCAFGYHVGAYVVNAKNSTFIVEDGILQNMVNDVILGCGIDQCQESYILLYSGRIAPYAFANCKNLQELFFVGPAPEFGKNCFLNDTIVVAYPKGNSTWTKSLRKNYGGTVEWESYTVLKPSTPKLTVSTDAASGHPKLTWSADENAMYYIVYRTTSKSGTPKVYDVAAEAKYIDSGTVPGKTYYYALTAVDLNEKETAASEKKSVTCKCARPVVTVKCNTTSGKPKLTWKAVEGAVKYEVYRATSKNGTYTKLKTTTSTSFTNTSAKAGTTYYYKVKAIAEKSTANSAYSTVKSVTCDCAKPVVTITRSSGHPKLKWDAVDGATGYVVYRATSKDGTYKKMMTTTKLSYTNTSATAGKTYYYKVMAITSKSSNADSAYSAVKSIKAQ